MKRFYVKERVDLSGENEQNGYLSVKGHRKRVRNDIKEKGTTQLSEHHLVEYLLFHGIPMKDTKSISYELVNRYGNLFGITNAPYEELIKIKGMTENAAIFLTSLGEIATRYMAESGDFRRLRGVEEIMSYLRKVIDPRVEACYLISLSKTNEMLSVERVMEGLDNALDIPIRMIVKRALDASLRRMIVVHNHPSGQISASMEDRKHTYKINAAFDNLQVEITDHIIIYEREAYSVKNDKFYRHNWRFR